MNRCAVVLVASLIPSAVSGQTALPRQVAAGAVIVVSRECRAAEAPILMLDEREIAATGANPKWQFNIPDNLELRNYTARWKCGPAEPGTETELGPLEVTQRAPTSRPGSTAASAEPKVISVSNVSRNGNGLDPRTELRDVLKIKVQNLKAWRAIDRNANTPLHLVLAGISLRNVVALPTSSDEGDGADVSALLVRLELDNERNDREGVIRKSWVQVLHTAHRRSMNEVEVSLAPPDQAPFASDRSARIALEVYPGYTWAVILFLIGIGIALFVLGRMTNLLRDSNGSEDPPYSLAKHQMALWFVVIIGSYLFVWMITGQFAAISNTALILIGISGATGLVAATMDAGKRANATAARVELEAERAALTQTLGDPATGLETQLRAAAPGSADALRLTAVITPKLARLQQLNALLNAPPADTANRRRWVIDLLSDDNGISFHRFQMAIWTLVLIAVFIRSVYNDILMPDFDATLLGLLGISAGTYLGFKFPEKTT